MTVFAENPASFPPTGGQRAIHDGPGTEDWGQFLVVLSQILSRQDVYRQMEGIQCMSFGEFTKNKAYGKDGISYPIIFYVRSYLVISPFMW